MKKQKKSGQVAVEFLMTYGWAFLVILGVIGAFTYLRVSPDELITPSCLFTDNIECLSHKMTYDEVILEIKNNVGRPINITRVECYAEGIENATTTNIYLRPGGSNSTVTCELGDEVLKAFDGTMVSANVIIYYVLDGQMYPRTSEGNVVGYVVEDTN